MPSSVVPASWLQILTFVVAGGICALLEFGLLIALVEGAGMEPLVANPFAFTVAVLLNYVLSRRWVFETGRHSRRRELTYFLVFSLLAFGVNQGFFWLFVDGFTLDYRVGKVLSIGGASVFNFLTKKFLVFKG